MSSGEVQIRDIAVTATNQSSSAPIGEAYRALDSLTPLTQDERSQMCTRLKSNIEELINLAADDHVSRNIESDPNYITRLSTNEFYFYTQEPLSLAEFEQLQNQLYNTLKDKPQGIQLILGSFAVQTPSGEVMNVTTHISNEEKPKFNFVVKQKSAANDFTYKNEKGENFKKCDKSTVGPDLTLPTLQVNNQEIDFSFNNLITSHTPGKQEVTTLIDICLDHADSSAKTNFLSQENLEEANPKVNHVLISNTLPAITENCIGDLFQADPRETQKKVQTQEMKGTLTPNRVITPFGKDTVQVFEMEPKTIKPWKQIQLDSAQQKKFKDYKTTELYTKNQNIFNSLNTLIAGKAIGYNDDCMKNFITAMNEKWNNCTTKEQHEELIEELRTIKDNLDEPINQEVKQMITSFKGSLSYGSKSKAQRIETAFAKIPIEPKISSRNTNNSVTI